MREEAAAENEEENERTNDGCNLQIYFTLTRLNSAGNDAGW